MMFGFSYYLSSIIKLQIKLQASSSHHSEVWYIPYRRYVHMFCFFRGAWAARAAGVLANWQGSFYKDFCDSCILDVLIALRENTVILMYD
jgi:hypothetical protein